MKKSKFLIKSFFFIIFFVAILYPINFFLINKKVITNNFSNNYNLKDNNLENLFYNLKNRIEVQMTNNFPLYNELNIYYRGIKNNINKSIYLNTNYNYNYLGTNVDEEYIFKDQNNNYIIQNQLSNTELDNRLSNMINLYNSLANYQDIIIYMPDRYEYRNYLNKNITIRNMSDYIIKFKDKLNDNITVNNLTVKSSNDYWQLFYHTDHHWNAYGAKKAYNDIMKLLNKEPYSLDVIELTNIEFHGSIAKSSGDIKEYDTLSYLYNKDILLPQDMLTNSLDTNFKPLKINKRNNLFYDYYIGFFNGMYPEVKYYNPNGQDNLLIIGDSYTWSIDYIIANSFKNTIILNPRYITEINYEEYLKENNIDKVLILMETQSILFDQYNYGLLDKLGGK